MSGLMTWKISYGISKAKLSQRKGIRLQVGKADRKQYQKGPGTGVNGTWIQLHLFHDQGHVSIDLLATKSFWNDGDIWHPKLSKWVDLVCDLPKANTENVTPRVQVQVREVGKNCFAVKLLVNDP